MKMIKTSVPPTLSRPGCLVLAAETRIWPAGLLAILIANAAAQPTIYTEPRSQSASLGATVTFRVGAAGGPPILYQWQYEDLDVSGATNSSFSLTNVQSVHSGKYRVVVADSTGSVPSQAAVLDVDPTFTRITSGSLVTDKGEFTGCAWGDFDNDGWPDLFVNSRLGDNRLYRNNRDGTFATVTTASLEGDTGTDHLAGLWGDYDNDGFLDLLAVNGGLAGNGRVVLYRNEGDGTFSRPSAALVGLLATRVGSFGGGAWGDFDKDGLLDIFITSFDSPNYLYRNLGGNQFAQVNDSSGKPASLGVSGIDAASADYDNDGDLDLCLVGTTSRLYENQGEDRFAPHPIGVASRGFGCSWADFNNDGLFDLCVTTGNALLFTNSGGASFVQLTNQPPGTNSGLYGPAWGDYDNDGWLDLFVSNGNRYELPRENSLYRNRGDGTFERILTGSLANERARSLGSAWGDYDNDGFLDLFVSNGFGAPESSFLYRNNGNSNGWLKVRCIGTMSNRTGIGTKVRVSARIDGQQVSQLRQISSTDGRTCGSLEAHFGLGNAAIIDTVRIEWPSGLVQEFHNVPVKQTLTMREPPRIDVIWKDGQLRVSLPGGKGLVYDIQSSADLFEWTSADTLTNSSGKVEYIEPDPAQQRQRFYRVLIR